VFRRTEVLMGTTVTIDAAGAEAEAALQRAFNWFVLVEQVCTRFDPRSELSQLTQNPGAAVAVGPLLFQAVQFAVHVAATTDGAFDPTVGAAMHRRGFDREHRTGTVVPPLADPSPDVSYRDVEIDATRHTITLRRPLLLDLGAVAKGLAVDLAARELEPCRDFAIDAGGDLYLGGVNAEGQPWSIGIRHPRIAGEVIAAVRVSNQAVCTSGDYERRTRLGQRADDEHHIIDPRTGASPTHVASVTVVAESAMLADALATAAFVLGPENGLSLLERMDVHGLIVTASLDLIRTKDWPGE
jgi:thiamine biosynthesis lipoprotein